MTPARAISGSVLWPGAELDGDGHPSDWPGWRIEDGIWVEGDQFDWVRPSADVRFEVNPEATIMVDDPPSVPFCNPNPDTQSGLADMPFDLDYQMNRTGTVDCAAMDRIIPALNREAAHFQKEINRQTQLKFTPKLQFRLDETYDKASRLEGIINTIKYSDQE